MRRGARVAHQERRADALLVGARLAHPPMLPEREAVVGHEDDDGVLQGAADLERIDHRDHQIVHRQERLEGPPVGRPELRAALRVHWGEGLNPRRLVGHVLLTQARGVGDRKPGQRPGIPGGLRPRTVRRRGGHLQEERTSRGSRADERDRGGRIDVGRVVVRTVAPVVGEPLVDQDVPVVRRRLVPLPLHQPPIPPCRDVRARAEGIAVHVLADQARVVPGGMQPGGDGRGLVEVLAVVVGPDPGVVRVPPGEDRGPGRAAERGVQERVRERDPVIRRVLHHRL